MSSTTQAGGAPANPSEASGFEALLAELSGTGALLQKSMSTEAAVDLGAGGGDDPDALEKARKAEQDRLAKAGGEGGGATVTKSLTVKTDTGEELEVIDATDLIKSLQVENAAVKTEAATLKGVVTKALEQSIGLNKALATQNEQLKAQSALIKSLQETVERIGATPTNRRAVLSVADKPGSGDMNKSLPLGGMAEGQFRGALTKALSSGAISGSDAMLVETRLNTGGAAQLPADVVTAISKFAN